MKYRVLMTVVLLMLGATFVYGQEIIAEIGVVVVEGDGTVALNGSGEVIIEGDGTLFIVDRTDTATIHIDSTKRLHYKEQKTRGNTVYTYRRFDGTATIIGEDIAVVMDGINIKVSVSGTGAMFVDGAGTYIINQDEPQQWSAQGDLITIGTVEP